MDKVKENIKKKFQIIFSIYFTQFIYSNYNFLLILVVVDGSHALNDRLF
jgi:hypothetical protein